MYIFPSIHTYICIESESEIESCVLSYTWQQKKRTIARTRLKQEQRKKENEQEHGKSKPRVSKRTITTTRKRTWPLKNYHKYALHIGGLIHHNRKQLLTCLDNF